MLHKLQTGSAIPSEKTNRNQPLKIRIYVSIKNHNS